MKAVDSAPGNLDGIAADMHDDALRTANEHVNEAESPVVEDALEDVERVVDDTRVDQVEDAHHNEYVEHVGQVARCAMPVVLHVVELREFWVLFLVAIGQSARVNEVVVLRLKLALVSILYKIC